MHSLTQEGGSERETTKAKAKTTRCSSRLLEETRRRDGGVLILIFDLGGRRRRAVAAAEWRQWRRTKTKGEVKLCRKREQRARETGETWGPPGFCSRGSVAVDQAGVFDRPGGRGSG